MSKIPWCVLALVGATAGAGLARAQDSRPSGRSPNPNARYEVAWATYLGCPGRDWLRKVVVLPDGSIVVGGFTTADGMPTTAQAVQPHYSSPDKAHPDRAIPGDFYLARLGASGQLIGATYFGGSNTEYQLDLAVDRQGNVIVAGETRSSDLRVTPGAAQSEFGGQTDWFAAKLTTDLKQLLWCTYLGGPGNDSSQGKSLLIDRDDQVILFGLGQHGFPQGDEDCDAGSRDPDDGGDIHVAKLLADGSRVVFSSRFGGTGHDQPTAAALMPDGSILLAGITSAADFPIPPKTSQIGPKGDGDCFVVKLKADGSRLEAMTLFGGVSPDSPMALIVADDGSLIVAGDTQSMDFPTTQGAHQRSFGGMTDGFIAKLAAPGGELQFSTLFGREGNEGPTAVRLGPDGGIWFASVTDNPNLSVTGDALHFYAGGESDGLLMAFAADGSRFEFATFLGGMDRDVVSDFAFGPGGEIYVVGATTSRDLPTSAGSIQQKPVGWQDGFVLKLVPTRHGAAATRPSRR